MDANTNQPKINYAIYIENFTKLFGKFIAVDNVTIKVEKGTIHGFIGPNGSGKTTTIKCLVSAMVPTQGSLLIHNIKSDTVAAKKHVGYIPEAARFPKRISTYNYLVTMGEVSGLKPKVAKQKAELILKDLNLWKFKKRNPNAYSSGMKKKVLLAQSLLNDPDVLILDEPAANLDPTARTELFNELRKLRDQGKTIFISSHILSELQTLIDDVTILNFSKVVYSDKIDKSKNYYEMSSTNNKDLKELLVKNKYELITNNDLLLIKINSNEEIKNVLELSLTNNIIINFLVPHVIDLQKIYEKLVIENSPKLNQKNGMKGKK